MTLTVLLAAPILAVWLVVLADVAVRAELSRPRRLLWAVSVTLLWPTTLLYVLLRPVSGRLVSQTRVRRSDDPDPGAELVEAALQHEAGRLPRADLERLIERARGTTGR